MNPNPAGLKTFIRLFAYLGGVLLLACLLSPPLYWIGSSLAQAGILPIVNGFPFHRYFSRSVQISAVILLWPAFRGIGIHRFSDLGIHPNRLSKNDLAWGFLLALAPLVALGSVYLLTGIFAFKSQWEVSGFFRICGTAAAVGTIEELLFRGVLLGLALRIMPRWAAAILSSACFALVHFMRTSRQALDEPVGWLSGFQQLPLVFSSAPPWPLLGWGILSLFLAGLVLAYGTLHTRSLFIPIGLHAGWIVGQQSLQLIARFCPKPSDAFLPWVGPNVVSGAVPTGLVPVFTLLATSALVWIYLNYATPRRF